MDASIPTRRRQGHRSSSNAQIGQQTSPGSTKTRFIDIDDDLLTASEILSGKDSRMEPNEDYWVASHPSTGVHLRPLMPLCAEDRDSRPLDPKRLITVSMPADVNWLCERTRPPGGPHVVIEQQEAGETSL